MNNSFGNNNAFQSGNIKTAKAVADICNTLSLTHLKCDNEIFNGHELFNLKAKLCS